MYDLVSGLFNQKTPVSAFCLLSVSAFYEVSHLVGGRHQAYCKSLYRSSLSLALHHQGLIEQACKNKSINAVAILKFSCSFRGNNDAQPAKSEKET